MTAPRLPDDTRGLMDRLDRALPPQTHTVMDGDADPLIGAARRLAQGPDIALSGAALDRIEARLRARTVELSSAAQSRPTPVRKMAPLMLPIGRFALRAAAACLILLLGVFGVERASAGSLPGDALYPAKRAVEDARLVLVSDNGEPGLRVGFAERRIAEFDRLLARGELYPRALEEASGQFNRALDLLAAGYGSRAALDQRIFILVQKQNRLLEQAVALAGQAEKPRLQTIEARTTAIQVRVMSEGSVTGAIPVPSATPTPGGASTAPPVTARTPTLPVSPVPTKPARPTSTMTMTPTSSPTATPTPTHSPTPRQGKPKDEADLTPSRTPPGHSGDNPGQGNDGQPPGQNKPKKDKSKSKK